MDDRQATDVAKSLVRRWVEMFNTGGFRAADEIAADRYLEHAVAPFGRTEPGAVNGPSHLRETADWLLAQFPDLTMEIVSLIAEGDLVAALIDASGSNGGPLDEGIGPTGRTFSARQTHWFRMAEGRLAEHWATRDDLTVMIQLGILPLPARVRVPFEPVDPAARGGAGTSR